MTSNETVKLKPTFAEPVLIDKLNLGFPVFAVDYSAATSTLFVAGGGGPAKTGVRNSIVRFSPFLRYQCKNVCQRLE